MNFDIGEPIARGWQITWKHKVLWIYGALPLVFAVVYLPLLILFVPLSQPDSELPERLLRLVQHPLFNPVFFLTALITTSLSLAAQLLGSTAMTLGAVRAEDGLEKQGLRELFKASLPFVGRVLGVLTLMFFVLMAFTLVFTACSALASAATMGVGGILFQLAIYPIFLAAWAVTELAQAAVVADGLGARDAMERGWDLFKEHLWKFVLIALVVYVASAFVTSFTAVPMALPIWFVMFSTVMLDAAPDPRLMLVSMLAAIAFFPLYALAYGVTLVFGRSTFVVAYLRLTRNSEARQAFLEAAGP